MTKINPTALFLVAFTTLVGAAFGSWVIGAAVGCGLVVAASVAVRVLAV